MNPHWKTRFLSSVVASHGRKLTRFFISRVPDAHEAGDLVQEVYLRLLRMDRPDLIRCPEAYLFTVAAHIAPEHRLKHSTPPLHVALDEMPIDELPADIARFETAAPEHAALQGDRTRKLETILAQLSPKARATLIWHRRDGQTYDEIGVRLGISRNMVKKYLSQALAH